MPTDLEAAWDDLHGAKPPGWFVGRPFYNERRKACEQYAFDPREKAKVGVRSREWTAVAPTQLEVIRELARCLRGDLRGAGAEVKRRWADQGIGAAGAEPRAVGGAKRTPLGWGSSDLWLAFSRLTEELSTAPFTSRLPDGFGVVTRMLEPEAVEPVAAERRYRARLGGCPRHQRRRRPRA